MKKNRLEKSLCSKKIGHTKNFLKPDFLAKKGDGQNHQNQGFFFVDLYLCVQPSTDVPLWVLYTANACEHSRNLFSVEPSCPGLDKFSNLFSHVFPFFRKV